MSPEKIDDLYSSAMAEFVGENFDRAVTLLNDVLKSEPGHKLALISRGAAHLKLSRPERAVADFDRAIELDPGYARAYHLRGLAREQLNDIDGALTDFSAAVERDPEYGAAYYSRATLYSRMGLEGEAFEDIQTVTGLTAVNLERFNSTHNVWQTQQMRLEEAMETELNR